MALLVLRSVGVVCRAKPNVPLVRWQKNKKMCVGQKLNLCLVSLSARFFCPFGLGSVVRYHCCQLSNIRKFCRTFCIVSFGSAKVRKNLNLFSGLTRRTGLSFFQGAATDVWVAECRFKVIMP